MDFDKGILVPVLVEVNRRHRRSMEKRANAHCRGLMPTARKFLKRDVNRAQRALNKQIVRDEMEMHEKSGFVTLIPIGKVMHEADALIDDGLLKPEDYEEALDVAVSVWELERSYHDEIEEEAMEYADEFDREERDNLLLEVIYR